MIGTTIQRILLATILLFSLTTGLQAQDDLLGTGDFSRVEGPSKGGGTLQGWGYPPRVG